MYMYNRHLIRRYKQAFRLCNNIKWNYMDMCTYMYMYVYIFSLCFHAPCGFLNYAPVAVLIMCNTKYQWFNLNTPPRIGNVWNERRASSLNFILPFILVHKTTSLFMQHNNKYSVKHLWRSGYKRTCTTRVNIT